MQSWALWHGELRRSNYCGFRPSNTTKYWEPNALQYTSASVTIGSSIQGFKALPADDALPPQNEKSNRHRIGAHARCCLRTKGRTKPKGIRTRSRPEGWNVLPLELQVAKLKYLVWPFARFPPSDYCVIESWAVTWRWVGVGPREPPGIRKAGTPGSYLRK